MLWVWERTKRWIERRKEYRNGEKSYGEGEKNERSTDKGGEILKGKEVGNDIIDVFYSDYVKLFLKLTNIFVHVHLLLKKRLNFPILIK